MGSGSSIKGISQARILEWVAISFSRGSSQSRDQTHVPCIGRQVLYHRATREELQACYSYSYQNGLLIQLKTVDHQVLRRMVWRKWAYRYITVFKRIDFSTEQYKPTNWFRFTFCGSVEGGGLQFSFSHLVTWEACCASRRLWFTWTQ